MQAPGREKVLRTVIVYALIAVLFRLPGTRGLAGLSTFDFQSGILPLAQATLDVRTAG